MLAVSFTPGPLAAGMVNLPALPLGPLATIAPQAGKPVVEPTISINPSNLTQVVASAQNGLRSSTDSGATFSSPPTLFPLANSDGDTNTGFDNQGRLFWVNLDNTSGGIFITQVNPTTGALVSGTFFAVDMPVNSSDDKEVLAIDQTNNNLYLVWTNFPNAGGSIIEISHSVDQGMTWSAPVTVSDPAEGFVWPSTIAVAPDGTIYVAYHATLDFNGVGDFGGNPTPNMSEDFVARYSNDLTTQLSKSVALDTTQADITFNIQNSPRAMAGNASWQQGSAQPWVLPDPVRPGNVYVIGTNDPTHSLTPTSDIVFARSTNNGAAGSWTFTDIVSGPTNTFRIFPTATIDPFGDIFVAWYDDRRLIPGTVDPTHFKLDVFATYSTDGGLTWATPFQVNDPSLPFDPDANASNRTDGPPPTTRIGEYFGITAFGNTAYLDWNSNTFGAGGVPTGQQVSYAALCINGSLTATGDDNGVVTNDTITVRREAANPAYLEILVNGQLQYVGLLACLSTLTLDGRGGTNTLIVDCTNGDPVPAGGLTYTNFQNVQNIACPLVPTTTTLVSSGTSSFGEAVTFTAIVTPTMPKFGPPTGTVSFFDGATLLGSSPLVNGQATFTTTTLAGGPHSIQAVYNGDPFYQTSTSAPLRQIVRAPAVFATGTGQGSPEVKVFDPSTGALKFDFFAYSPFFTGGVRVAVGDVNGDGLDDIITGPGPGLFPEIKVFDGGSGAVLRDFSANFAFEPLFTGGVFVAAGDINQDGFADILVGADQGGAPEVKVFSGGGSVVPFDFLAFEPAFTGGVRVAVGDVTGDRFADLVVGRGPGAMPEIKVFNGRGGALLQDYLAFAPGFAGGVFVAAGDVNGDGRADVIAGRGMGGGPEVRVFDGSSTAVIRDFFAYPPDSTPLIPIFGDGGWQSGLHVGFTTIHGRAAILTGPGALQRPEVKAFDASSLQVLDDFFAYDPGFLGGVFVGGG